VVATLLVLSACQRSAPKPSIILILVDTLRADYLGVYGFDGPISPRIDAFVAESVLFENCFAQAPWTKPSTASLLTSLQPGVHRVLSHRGQFLARRVVGNSEALSEEAVTLAEALHAGGYATGAFVANPWVRPEHGFNQGFDVFDLHPAGKATPSDPIKAARRWIAELPKDRPYFAYIHLMDVHGPYNAPEEDYEAVRNSHHLGGEPIPLTQLQILQVPKYLRKSPWMQANPDDVRVWRARYAANVHAADRHLGEFFAELRADGALERSIVVLTADHGEQLHEHGGWDHGYGLYDEELHVPLIVRLPGGRTGGRRIAAVVSLIDVMPTIVKLTGAPAVGGMQGRDLSESLEGRSSGLRSAPSFATAVKWKPGLQSVRTERHKFIKDSQNYHTELYDLQTDRSETTNIAGASPALDGVRELLTVQDTQNEAHGMLQARRVDLPPRLRARLRALGYYDEAPPVTP
jgi:arylsulfatase A-like enzyme